ncbi:DUF4153 domain-containing protein [Tenacibaculum maritimum]|uniref:DUF4153 domain-containing protein n=1 Tax=Tenacibaculum maritimum TaxID=107401 RepID=UPI0012E400C9|nr:DUF4153 domain-containing protein [Tenacibaculum maritimum]CAA0155131.1 conserved membrane hypothetical protein [Tenacibaculum maritimum]
MKLFFSFGKIKDTFKRFPLALTWCIISSLFIVYIIEVDVIHHHLLYYKLLLTFVLGVSWLIATHFFQEQFHYSKKWLFIFPIGFLCLFYYHLSGDKKIDLISWYRFILYFIAGHLLVLAAPFLLKWKQLAFFNYLKNITKCICKSLLFTGIIFSGIIIALLATKHLFNIHWNDRLYLQIFVLCIGIINTWIFLFDIPKKIASEKTMRYSKASKVLVQYILIPLAILYLTILYAYSLKIIIHWNLPKGWISYLVIGVSLLGFLIQILINPIQKITSSKIIKQFHPWFYISLLPLLILLFTAIFKRINAYGVTEKRYFVLLLSVWILGVVLYLLFSKQQKTTWLLFSLTTIIVLSSFGVWGAFSFSTKSQVSEFKRIYAVIKEKNNSISYKENHQFQSIIKYLTNKHELSQITPILGYDPVKAFNTTNYWTLQDKITDSLGIKTEQTPEKNKHLFFHLESHNHVFHSKGYDYFKEFIFTPYKKEEKLQGVTFTLDSEKNAIVISLVKQHTIKYISLKDMTRILLEKPTNVTLKNVADLTIEKSFDELDLKIIFTNITFDKNNIGFTISDANGYLLLKEKNAE